MAQLTQLQFDPANKYEVRLIDLEYRNDGAEAWPARVYQPVGAGPFPVMLDIHGGSWNAGNYLQNYLLDEEIAACGMVVVSFEFRKAPKHPYPAQVQDVHYATRWLKAHAGDFGGVAEGIGALGTSSGGHTVLLSAMRPKDARYGALAVEGETGEDASLEYVLALWPVLDPYSRYFFAHETGMDRLVENTEKYFLTYETIREANPQLILERGEQVLLPAVQIVQPFPDINIPRSLPERFFEVYQKAGGQVELEWFPEMPHGFARSESDETQRALRLMKDFISRQLARASTATGKG